jgi:poly(3-hydroxybutyrate) depolymerase
MGDSPRLVVGCRSGLGQLAYARRRVLSDLNRRLVIRVARLMVLPGARVVDSPTSIAVLGQEETLAVSFEPTGALRGPSSASSSVGMHGCQSSGLYHGSHAAMCPGMPRPS